MYFLPTEQSVPTVSSRRPGRLVPLPVAKVMVGMADVVQLPAMLRRAAAAISGTAPAGYAGRLRHRARRSSAATIARIQCSRQHAAGIGDADDHRPGAPRLRLRRSSCLAGRNRPCSRRAGAGRRTIRAPVDDALRRLGRELVGHIAQEQEVGSADFHDGPSRQRKRFSLPYQFPVLGFHSPPARGKSTCRAYARWQPE